MKIPVFPCTAWEKNRFIARWHFRLKWGRGAPEMAFIERYTPARDESKMRNVHLVFIKRLGMPMGEWIDMVDVIGGIDGNGVI